MLYKSILYSPTPGIWLSLDLKRVSPVIKNLLFDIVFKFEFSWELRYDPGPGSFVNLEGFNVVLTDELPKGGDDLLGIEVKVFLDIFFSFDGFEFDISLFFSSLFIETLISDLPITYDIFLFFLMKDVKFIFDES